MTLCSEDIALFYRLHPALLVYANQQMQTVPGVSNLEEFMAAAVEDRIQIREAAYQEEGLIDSFVQDNPFHFTPAELALVESWKDRLAERFFVFRYLKAYTVFLSDDDPPRAYGVVALNDRLEDLLGPYVPILVKAVLLPFKDQIIYDGFLSPYRVSFGGGIRRSMNENYRDAKARFGIITRLPFLGEEEEESDLERLKFYLRTKDSRELYADEIQELLGQVPDMQPFYHQEMGRLEARTYQKRLKEMGIGGWFAFLQGIIVASGSTREQVEQILEELLPPEKRSWPFLFRVKGR